MSGIKNIATAKVQEGTSDDDKPKGKSDMDKLEAAYKETAGGRTSLKE